jgi:hypothetical protein
MNGTVNPDREDEDNACFPSELRFVRCGRRERWREANLGHQEIHFGWSEFPHRCTAKQGIEVARMKQTLKDISPHVVTEHGQINR